MAAAAQQADEFQRFVCRDAAGDDQENALHLTSPALLLT
jgi:hypothetical protein